MPAPAGFAFLCVGLLCSASTNAMNVNLHGKAASKAAVYQKLVATLLEEKEKQAEAEKMPVLMLESPVGGVQVKGSSASDLLESDKTKDQSLTRSKVASTQEGKSAMQVYIGSDGLPVGLLQSLTTAQTATAAFLSMKKSVSDLSQRFGKLKQLNEKLDDLMDPQDKPKLADFHEFVRKLLGDSEDLNRWLAGLHPMKPEVLASADAPQVPLENDLQDDSAENVLEQVEELSHRMNWDLQQARLQLFHDEGFMDSALEKSPDLGNAINTAFKEAEHHTDSINSMLTKLLEPPPTKSNSMTRGTVATEMQTLIQMPSA